MDFRVCLDDLENIKISCSFRDSNPASSNDCADKTSKYKVCLLK